MQHVRAVSMDKKVTLWEGDINSIYQQYGIFSIEFEEDEVLLLMMYNSTELEFILQNAGALWIKRKY